MADRMTYGQVPDEDGFLRPVDIQIVRERREEAIRALEGGFTKVWWERSPQLVVVDMAHLLADVERLTAEVDRFNRRSITFHERFVKPILSGQKTQSTRLLKPGKSWSVPAVHEFNTPDGRVFARAALESVRVARLRNLLYFDDWFLVYEGFMANPGMYDRPMWLSAQDAFREFWTSIYGPWEPDVEVAVLGWRGVERVEVGGVPQRIAGCGRKGIHAPEP